MLEKPVRYFYANHMQHCFISMHIVLRRVMHAYCIEKSVKNVIRIEMENCKENKINITKI